MAKERLDILLVEKGLCPSREKAQAIIMAGEVWSGGQRLEKPGMKLSLETPIEIRGRQEKFVSRAGEKLEHALATFGIGVENRVCLDVGASTGGFTDCLLQRGARHVFAVDVGHGQLDQKLRLHPCVTNVENKNARFLTLTDLVGLNEVADKISCIVMDVSFISIEKIIPPLKEQFLFVPLWIFLFKPQFEVGREWVGKGGVVRSDSAVQEALERFQSFMSQEGFLLVNGPESSPLTGKKSGNLEYLLAYELLGELHASTP